MAKYGARNSMFALWDTKTPDNDPRKLPKYQAPKTFGKLNKVSDTPNFNEGSLPGDDTIALYEKRFKDGTVDASSVYLPVADAASLLGAQCDDDNGMSRGDDDEAPYVGYGFMCHHVGSGKSYFQVIFYPKLKANPAAESYETRGDNINFTAETFSFHWESPACRKHKIIKDFDTEEAAKTYLEALFAGTAAVPGLPSPSEAVAAPASNGPKEDLALRSLKKLPHPESTAPVISTGA